MTNRNKKVDKVEIGTNAPRPNDEVVWIDSQNLNINIYNENTSEWVSVGGSGGENVDLVVPTAIKDSNGDDFISFERTGTGTARIETPQDDLSLRSARDITLFAGTEGPGNVYIGWGDATITPDATNRVATIADVQEATGLGNFTFDASTATIDGNQTMYLKALNNTDDVDAQLVLDPDNNAARIEAYGFEGNTTFYASNSEWTEATWNTNGTISFIDSSSVLSYITAVADVVNRVKVFVNETFVGYYAGTSLGNPVNGMTITLSGGPTPPAEPVTITQLDLISAFKSKIEINYDANEVKIEGKDLDVRISSDDDVFIEATGDDVHVRANDDIRFISNWMNDAEEPEYNWRMNSEGRFTFPGDGYIENPPLSDSETSLKSTFKIVPDTSVENDQYLIVEPTGGEIPHIHIRSGGSVDNSTTNLILGGEMNNVIVSDIGRAVAITSRPALITNNILNENVSNGIELLTEDTAPIMVGYTVNVDGTNYIVDLASSTGGVMTVTANGAIFTAGATYTFTYNPPWTNEWTFNSDGVLTGPAMGGLWVTGISGKSEEWPLYVTSPNAVSISGDEGEFLGDPNDPENQIATIGDLPTGASGSFSTATHTITVTNGIITDITTL